MGSHCNSPLIQFMHFSNSNGYFPLPNSILSLCVPISNCYTRSTGKTEKKRKDKRGQNRMCTPWTLTRFVRWRVRDWASCFLACRFPLEEEEAETSHSASSQAPIADMVFETKDDTEDGNKKSKKKLSEKNRCNKKDDRQLNLSPSMSRNTASVENGSDNSSWPRSSDEEYIVFCFREDGAFDVVKDCKSSEESTHSIKCSSRPVNRKLKYGEDAERDKQSNNEGRSNEDGNEEEEIIPAKEGDGEGNSICLEIDLASGSLRRRRHRHRHHHHQVEKTPTRGMVSVESSDSNQSDGSTGSFAFPVLGREWMGSPVQMPKSEDMSPRKNKPLSVHFQCLRF